MSQVFIFFLVIVSMAIWVMVSKEAAKSSNEISRGKMITLLSVGSLSTLFISIVLIQSLL
ncbi:hypothetical protein ACFFGV_15360 [Pontibacillus salicampi]|uniref:Uncharacterized protein n=1 Tax=Pontibacillus salicampi TaxID=1449801 RepID=A0ABV6LRA9_9BACI